MAQESMTVSEFLVGDEVIFTEKRAGGESRDVMAKVVEIRIILGKQTYVIETEQGKRKVVGESQIFKG